jgi:hypothetical protein
MIEKAGLAFRGAFHPQAADLPSGLEAGTLALVGFLGGENWPAFAASPEASDGAPDPLDRWSRRIVGAIADELGAKALFPFGGPPFLPFMRWAQRAETLFVSPLGLLIHPDYGLWHSFRGALAFRMRMELPDRAPRAHPCETCADRPCLTACPVGAYKPGAPGAYDVATCVSHIKAPEGAECMERGCLARRACPVGAAHTYAPVQARHHMKAFRNAQ